MVKKKKYCAVSGKYKNLKTLKHYTLKIFKEAESIKILKKPWFG